MPWLWARSLELRAVILICPQEEKEDTAGTEAVNFKGKEVFYMPRLNGTGPAGMGPMTGRGQGYCNPSQVTYGSAPAGRSGYRAPGYGQGFGRAQGFGQGRGFNSGRGLGAGRGRGFGRRGIYPARRTW